MAFRAADPAMDRRTKAKGLAKHLPDAPCRGLAAPPSLLTRPPLNARAATPQ